MNVFANEEKAFTFEKINSTSGLLVEEIGTMKTYNTHWTIVSHINLTYFLNDSHHLENILFAIKDVCESSDSLFAARRINFKTSCGTMLIQMEKMTENVKNHIDFWIKENNFQYRRNDLVEVNGNEYIKLFEKMNKDQQKQQFIETKQMTLIEINFEKLKNISIFDETEIFYQEIEKVKTTIQFFRDFQNSLDEHKRVLFLQNKLHSLVDSFIILMEQFNREQIRFFELLKITCINSDLSYLVPLEILRRELENIQSFSMKSELELPFAISKNVNNFHKITVFTLESVNNSLLIRFSIPLIEKDGFEIYRAVSFPYKLEKTDLYAFIVPKHTYFGLSNDKKEIIVDINEKWKNCYSDQSGTHICKKEFSKLNLMHSELRKSCELRMLSIFRNLYLEDSIDDDCDVRIVNSSSEMWLKLYKPNTYIYLFPKPQNVTIICKDTSEGNFEEILTLKQTGIITIRSNCQIHSKKVTILSSKLDKLEFSKLFMASFSTCTNISSKINKLQMFKHFHLPKINDFPTTIEELYQNSFNLNDLHEMEHILLDEGSLDIFIEFLINILFTLIGIFLVIFISVFKQCLIKRKSNKNKIENVYTDIEISSTCG